MVSRGGSGDIAVTIIGLWQELQQLREGPDTSYYHLLAVGVDSVA